MTISIMKNAEETTLELAGKLNPSAAYELEKTIFEEIENTKNLVFDLKRLKHISSAGLCVFLSTQKKMQKIGIMKIRNVREDVMKAFEMTGFTGILTFE